MEPFDGTEEPEDDAGQFAERLSRVPLVKWALVAFTAVVLGSCVANFLRTLH